MGHLKYVFRRTGGRKKEKEIQGKRALGAFMVGWLIKIFGMAFFIFA